MSEVHDKNMMFYSRAQKEYQACRPITYEFSLTKEDPKSKKFRILVNKFVEIFKEGMIKEYKHQIDEDEKNYWDELEINFQDYIEMKYIISQIYENREVKIRIFMMLLLNNRKIFRFLEEVPKRIPKIYLDPEGKLKNLEKETQCIKFFNDWQFTITSTTSNYIAQFKAFWEAEEAKMLLFVKEIKEILNEMTEEVERRENLRIQIEEQKIEDNKRKLQDKKKGKVQPEVNTSSTKAALLMSPPSPSPLKTQQEWNTPPGYQEQANWDKKPRGMKNSEYLYIKKYKDEQQVFDNTSHPFSYEFQISKDNKTCEECGKALSHGFYIFGNDINLCNDTGKWFCNDHMASQRIQVPHKAKNDFDLKGYPVSRRSYQRIKLFYEMPIIELRHDQKVVYEHKILYDFMVLKRQLHLMYDSICNTEYMDKTFTKKINYCLKKNLFSLKNLYDIYNGHETSQIEKDYAILQRHFYKCEICQSRKGRLCHICNNPPKIFSFELRQTYSCKHCKNIYHRRCLSNNICPCQRQ